MLFYRLGNNNQIGHRDETEGLERKGFSDGGILVESVILKREGMARLSQAFSAGDTLICRCSE